jgi:hypothetical protein
LLAEIPARTFQEWQCFYAMEPWGEERADIQAGIVASTLANAWRAKGQRPYKVEQFIPQWWSQKEQSAQDQIAMCKMLNAMFGGVET